MKERQKGRKKITKTKIKQHRIKEIKKQTRRKNEINRERKK